MKKKSLFVLLVLMILMSGCVNRNGHESSGFGSRDKQNTNESTFDSSALVTILGAETWQAEGTDIQYTFQSNSTGEKTDNGQNEPFQYSFKDNKLVMTSGDKSTEWTVSSFTNPARLVFTENGKNVVLIPAEKKTEPEEKKVDLVDILTENSPWKVRGNDAVLFKFDKNGKGSVYSEENTWEMTYKVTDMNVTISYAGTKGSWKVTETNEREVVGKLDDATFALVHFDGTMPVDEKKHPAELTGVWIGRNEEGNLAGLVLTEEDAGFLDYSVAGSWTLKHPGEWQVDEDKTKISITQDKTEVEYDYEVDDDLLQLWKDGQKAYEFSRRDDQSYKVVE